MKSGASFLVNASLNDTAPETGYPFDIAAARQIERIEFDAVTIMTGDNGTGKSTIIEALAIAARFNAEGGSLNLRFATHPTHSVLHEHLVLRWSRRPRWGWFLRAETVYGMATHVAGDPYLVDDFPDLHAESHGESFLDLIARNFGSPGLYLLDEPEAALSIQGQMKLARLIHEATLAGAQFVVATHSPFLLAYPDAAIHQLSTDGIERIEFNDLTAVNLWQRFFHDPDAYYQRLISE